jgi:hypothetical protein
VKKTGYQKELSKSKATVIRRIILGAALGAALALFYLKSGFVNSESNSNIAGGSVAALAAYFLIAGISAAVRLTVNRKSMKLYGVSDADEERFDAEYADWHLTSATGTYRRKSQIAYAEISRSWFLCRNPGSTVLLPLSGVIWFYTQVRQQYGTNSVYVYFSDGKRYEVFCGRQSVQSNADTCAAWLASLAELCPQALAGYSHRRFGALSRNKKQFIEDVKNNIHKFDEE